MGKRNLTQRNSEKLKTEKDGGWIMGFSDRL